MQLTDLRDAVRQRVGVSSADQLAGDAAVTDLLNSALRRVTMDNKVGWPWLRRDLAPSTAAGIETYPFKGGATHALDAALTVDKVVSVAVAVAQSYVPLERTLLPLLRDNYTFVAGSGVPLAWAPNGRAITFGPVPDAAYTLRVTAVVAEDALVDGTDEPLLPDTFIDLLIDKAAAMLCMRMRNPGDAQGFEVAYRGSLMAALAYAKTYVGPAQVIESDMLRTSAAP